MSSDTLIELGEIVIKNNFFEFDRKTFKRLRGTAIGTKFASPYAIFFMADLEEKILNAFKEMVEVHRRHFFYLGTWRKISGKVSQ